MRSFALAGDVLDRIRCEFVYLCGCLPERLFIEHISILVFMCIYLFFHYETWYERIIYISISISVVCLIIKVMPGRPAD